MLLEHMNAKIGRSENSIYIGKYGEDIRNNNGFIQKFFYEDDEWFLSI